MNTKPALCNVGVNKDLIALKKIGIAKPHLLDNPDWFENVTAKPTRRERRPNCASAARANHPQ